MTMRPHSGLSAVRSDLTATARPRRVLLVNSWSTAHGGSSTSLIDIATHLDPLRYRPIVMCPVEGDLPERLREAGVPVVISGMHRPTREELHRFVPEAFMHWRWLRAQRIDLVHGNTSASRRSIVQATVSAGIPYVQHVRNVIKNPRSSYGYQVADRIVCNSDATAAVFKEESTLKGKTVTIYNAVDLSQYEADGDTRRAELGIEPSRPVIGFVGQIVPRKGVLTLITAMASIVERVPEALLVVVGCPPPDETGYEEECRHLTEALRLESHVRFMGYRRDVPAFMRTFDVFALPTRSEPFGKVVIEAMAGGAPVVATRVGGIPEIVTNTGLGTLIPPDDPAALADAVLALLIDPARRKAVAAQAMASVKSRFTMSAMLGHIQALYDDLLDRRAAGARVKQKGAA